MDESLKMDSNSRHLIVIRISDSSAVGELQKKVIETATMYRDLPGADVLKGLGASPLLNPDSVSGTAYQSTGFRAVLFRLAGTHVWVLMALGSATKTNMGLADNAFVTLLGESLVKARAASMWAADISRLIRTIDYLSATWVSIRDNCRYLHYSGQRLDTTDPNAHVQFLFAAMTASQEGLSVVTRTLIGKMRSYLAGTCPLSDAAVPPGYRRGADEKLALEGPDATQVVRRIVQVLGDETLTDGQRSAEVAAIGGMTKAVSQLTGGPIPVDAVANKNDQVARWYRLLDVWRNGTWIIEYEIPEILHNLVFDLPVDIGKRGDRRIWLMRFDLPVPPGGWASADEFDAAEAVRDMRLSGSRATGGAANTARKPFCGLPAWEQDDFQYILLSYRAGLYQLRRRPASKARQSVKVDGTSRWVARGWGRAGNREGEVVARVAAGVLHASVVNGLVGAATEGLDAHNVTSSVLQGQPDVDGDLRKELADLRRSAANARRNANEARTEQQRRHFLCDFNDLHERIGLLEQDLFTTFGRAEGSHLPVDANAIANALGAVADESDYVLGEVANALRQVLSGFRLIPIDETTARWHVSLRVQLAGGVITLGPATGVIEVGLPREIAHRRNASLASRAAEAAQLVMGDGLDIAQTTERLGLRTPRRVAQAVRDHLKELGLSDVAVRALVSYSPPSARLAVWERLCERPYPQGMSERFAAHVSACYLNEDRRDQSMSKVGTMRRTLAEIGKRGGWVASTDVPDLCRSVGVSESSIKSYCTSRRRKYGFHPPILERRERGIGLRPCPHPQCGVLLTLYVAAIEVPTNLLCERCLRMPDPDFIQIQFPSDYRETYG